jgi:hypothetical protein
VSRVMDIGLLLPPSFDIAGIAFTGVFLSLNI